MSKIKTLFMSKKLLFKLLATVVLLTALVFCFSKISTAKMIYTITDSDNIIVVESYSDNTDEIISDAGIILTNYDSYITNKVDENNYEISILRFHQVEYKYGDYYATVLTDCDTVKDFLLSMDVDLSDIYSRNHALDDEIYDGMYIRIRFTSEETAKAEARAAQKAAEEEAARKAAEEKAAQEAAEAALAVRTPSLTYGGVTPAEDGSNAITTASGEVITYSYAITAKATAYTTEGSSDKITATGTVARFGAIAVDPSVIPYGTRMYIVSADGTWTYGYATAEDCGGSINGNFVDLFFDTYNECIQFGVRTVTVYILP